MNLEERKRIEKNWVNTKFIRERHKLDESTKWRWPTLDRRELWQS